MTAGHADPAEPVEARLSTLDRRGHGGRAGTLPPYDRATSVAFTAAGTNFELAIAVDVETTSR